MIQLLQKAIQMKALLGILALLAGVIILLGAILHANQQAAEAAKKLAAERDRAAQIDRDDKAAVEAIRKRNREKAAAAAASHQ